ncbi:MAG: hypothetical protein ACR2O4_07645 [Hyphomicrobiaceae bacterium]
MTHHVRSGMRREGLAAVLAVAPMLVLAPAAFAADTPASPKPAENAAKPAPDPRAGDPNYEKARQMLSAIDSILEDTARNRSDARKLPSRDDFLVTPLWSETKEDREEHIRSLLDSALGIVTDVPIVDMQKTIEGRRKAIQDLQVDITKLREKQLTAPKDALLPGILTDTFDSLSEEIKDLETRIEANNGDIAKSKTEIHTALSASGITMSPDQLDLLLDSVLSSDLVRLVATFNAAKVIDEQLGQIVQTTGDDTKAARKYFAMHAALFAMLVHAQDQLINKIDTKYMPRLMAIEKDINRASKDTKKLLKGKNRDDQKRALKANLKSQGFAKRVAQYYRGYLLQQREQLAKARLKAIRDLRIADNTYETVEASFQLRALIKDATSSFEAIQKLEAPGFDQIFKDQELRREFENLTRKLDVPTS